MQINKIARITQKNLAPKRRQVRNLSKSPVFQQTVNAEQIEGLPEKFMAASAPLVAVEGVGRLESVDHFIGNIGVTIRHGGDRAYYSEHSDHIQMPCIDAFKDAESYYATLTHEATHATKHASRLNRDFGRVVWGDAGYAKEELVAEIGAAFLCADLGITPEIREDHAAYIETWLQALKNDKKLIFTAAAHASRAVEFMKSKQPAVALDRERSSGAAPDYQTLYCSAPLEIGKNSWRLIIERAGGGVQTRYEFQDESKCYWHRSQEWPRYDINDTYLGLPRGLARLYEREQPALIKHGLIAPPVVKQLALAI